VAIGHNAIVFIDVAKEALKNSLASDNLLELLSLAQSIVSNVAN